MFGLIIFCTIVYLLKMLVDYIYSKSGIISVSGIRGIMVGFDVEETIMDYKNPDSDEEYDVVQVTIEISLFFISIVFIYQEDLPSDQEDGYVH